MGNLQSLAYGNGVTNLCQYDNMNRLTNQLWQLHSTALASFAYTLGPTGNRIALWETVNGASRAYAWAYDSMYRLTQETLTGNTSGTLNYGYDLVGNRTSRTSSLSALTNQNFTFTTNDWLASEGYDNNGNTTNSSGNTYRYDVPNHATNVNNGAILMAYDGDGNRARKTVGGTTNYYLLDDRNPSGYVQVLEEWTTASGGTNLNRVYNYGSDLISQRAPGTSTNYFVFDGHGSTRILVDIGGTVQNAFAYDAYGTLIAYGATPQTAYLYCGQQFDADLGMYLNRARYMSQNTGRFWTMDTDEGDQKDPLSLHKYNYCAGDPVNGSDLSGHDYFGNTFESSSQIFGQLLNAALTGGNASLALITSCNNMSSDEESQVLQARSDAINYADEAVSYMNSVNPMYAPARYVKWYGKGGGRGAVNASYFNDVKQGWSQLDRVLHGVNLSFTAGKPRYLQYLPWGDKGMDYYGDSIIGFRNSFPIRLGDYFWAAPATGQDSKAGTIIHELTHMYLGTLDYDSDEGDPDTDLELARTNPGHAINNANIKEYISS